MKFLSLFSGIGGLDLGLERAGMKCIAQVEIDPYCRQVLAKHWPDVPRFEDVTKFCRRLYDCEPESDDGESACPRCSVEDNTIDFGECGCIGTDQFTDECGFPDIIAGGFPCQDISHAGLRAGIDGDRSGLWREFHRIIRELNPRFALIENTSGLQVRGMSTVLNDLFQVGYDAEWSTIPASCFGAAHRRERVFILAYPAGNGLEGRITAKVPRKIPAKALDNMHDFPALSAPLGIRTTNGFPGYVERITALGNAVVPHVAEFIGRRIMENEHEIKR